MSGSDLSRHANEGRCLITPDLNGLLRQARLAVGGSLAPARQQAQPNAQHCQRAQLELERDLHSPINWYILMDLSNNYQCKGKPA